MNYQGNPKDVYLNSFSLLLVFAYLRMSIMRRSNQYRLDEDILEKQIQFPEAYNDYYKDMAEELGVSVRTFGKIVNCLRDELHLIQFEEIGRTKYITDDGKVKWKTNHTIFCNSYKRERDYLLTDSESYWITEIANKKQKIGIKGDQNVDTLANKISDSYYELSERDIYPPEDKRTFRAGVLNTDGDSYEEFAQDYNDMCEEEEMYES